MRNRIFILAICIGLMMMAGGCRTAGNEEADSSESIADREATTQETVWQETSMSEEDNTEGAVTTSEEDMYSGTYVDRQGTEDIYSELELRYLEEGVYEVFVGIFRVGASEGIARTEGEILLFEAEGEPLIRGEIRIQDSEAVLTITESDFSDIEAGQVFIFPEKLP